MATVSPAEALVLAPGASANISGVFGGGGYVVIVDELRPLTLSDGTVITVQDRVGTNPVTHNLEFGRMIRNTSTMTVNIVDVSIKDFAGYTTDVNFDTSSLGLAAPSYVQRDAAGWLIVFSRYNPSDVAAGSMAKFVYSITDGYAYGLTGTTAVDAYVGTTLVTGVVQTLSPISHSLLPGDANQDGKVSFADYLILEGWFGHTSAGWNQGDFNHDGKVSFADYLILEANFAKSAPEPATLSLLALGGLAMVRRRK